MSKYFFHLSQDEQLWWIKQAAEQLDVSDFIIEKDLWMCWLLEKLFELPIPMVFKGGTSLSKIFGLIKRFSEDCDITIDYRYFNRKVNLTTMNRTQIKKMSQIFKIQLKDYIYKTIFPYLKNKISEEFPKEMSELVVNEEGDQLRFYYPSLINVPDFYLRDHVFIEFGIRNSIEPFKQYPLIPYLTQAINEDIVLPRPRINTLSPLRTFWEKATLIHVECHRDRLVKTPERLSRHWYDLFMLKQAWVGAEALLNFELLRNVLEHKDAFFYASYANYKDCLSGKFRLIPEMTLQGILEQDFKEMVKAEMFYVSPPTFIEIMYSLKDLESIINQNFSAN